MKNRNCYEKIKSISIKILNILLGVLGVYLLVCIFVFVVCLTANMGRYIPKEMSHEDVWVVKGYQPAEWANSPVLTFDLKEWSLPVIWAPEK